MLKEALEKRTGWNKEWSVVGRDGLTVMMVIILRDEETGHKWQAMISRDDKEQWDTSELLHCVNSVRFVIDAPQCRRPICM